MVVIFRRVLKHRRENKERDWGEHDDDESQEQKLAEFHAELQENLRLLEGELEAKLEDKFRSFSSQMSKEITSAGARGRDRSKRQCEARGSVETTDTVGVDSDIAGPEPPQPDP